LLAKASVPGAGLIEQAAEKHDAAPNQLARSARVEEEKAAFKAWKLALESDANAQLNLEV
jgi:hypothetical protein